MKIEWSDASTKRGIIWVATALVGAIFIFLGKPVDQLLLLAGGVAGDRIFADVTQVGNKSPGMGLVTYFYYY